MQSSSNNKMSTIVHELAQTLSIIHSYVQGCIVRIKNNDLELSQFHKLLIKINDLVKKLFSTIESIIAC